MLEASETLDIGPPAAVHLLELVANAMMHANTTTLWSLHSAKAGRVTHLSTLIPVQHTDVVCHNHNSLRCWTRRSVGACHVGD